MRKYIGRSLSLLVLFTCSTSFIKLNPISTQDWRVVIIRHGEKPADGDNLSCQGLQRSLQLATVLHQKFGIVQQIYVPAINTGKTTRAARMYQTVLPYAIKYNLEVNSKYEVNETEKLVTQLKDQTGTSLVVWEHKEIAGLIKVFDLTGKWDDSDYDSIWILTRQNGKTLLTKDKENIHPASVCP